MTKPNPKMNELGLSAKHINVATAILMSMKEADGNVNWDMFQHYAGYTSMKSAKDSFYRSKKEIRTMMDAQGDFASFPGKKGESSKLTAAKKPVKAAAETKKSHAQKVLDLELDDDEEDVKPKIEKEEVKGPQIKKEPFIKKESNGEVIMIDDDSDITMT